MINLVIIKNTIPAKIEFTINAIILGSTAPINGNFISCLHTILLLSIRNRTATKNALFVPEEEENLLLNELFSGITTCSPLGREEGGDGRTGRA